MTTLSTKDYSIFRKSERNRANGISERHVKLLMKNIVENNLLEVRPILVGQDMIVLDGQHRLEAAKRLGLEIFYTLDERLTEDDILSMTGINLKWTVDDVINFYAKSGNDNYIRLYNFAKRHSLPCSIAVRVGKVYLGRNRTYFKKGGMEFTKEDEAFSEDFMDYYKRVHEIIIREKGNSQVWKSEKFLSSLLSFYRLEDMDKEHFLKNLSFCSGLIGHKATREMYRAMFVKIYNYKLKKNKISFGEDQHDELDV